MPRGTTLAICGLVTLLYLYSFPYFERIRSANELPRVYQAISIVDLGRLDVNEGVSKWGATPDLARSGGHIYPNKAPGMSFLAAGVYYMAKRIAGLDGAKSQLRTLVRLLRLGCATVPALLFLWFVLPGLLTHFGLDENAIQATLVAYATGTMAMTYGTLLIGHQLAAVLLGTSYCFLLPDETKRMHRFGWAGALSGLAVCVEYQAALAIPLLLLYVARTAGWRAALYFVTGGLPCAVLLAGYHLACFGSVFSTGVELTSTPRIAADLKKGWRGLGLPRFEMFSLNFLSTSHGLFALSPILLAIIPGLWLLRRRPEHRSDSWLGVLVLCAAIFLGSSLHFRGGWRVGPRYLTVFLPLLLPALGSAFAAGRKHTWTWILLGGLTVASMIVYSLSTATFPHFPEAFGNPFFGLVLRLITDDMAPHNLGRTWGLSGTASLVPYFTILAVLILFVGLSGGGARVRRLACTVGVLAVGALYLGTLRYVSRTPSKQEERAYRWIQIIWEP